MECTPVLSILYSHVGTKLACEEKQRTMESEDDETGNGDKVDVDKENLNEESPVRKRKLLKLKVFIYI